MPVEKQKKTYFFLDSWRFLYIQPSKYSLPILRAIAVNNEGQLHPTLAQINERQMSKFATRKYGRIMKALLNSGPHKKKRFHLMLMRAVFYMYHEFRKNYITWNRTYMIINLSTILIRTFVLLSVQFSCCECISDAYSRNIHIHGILLLLA